MPGSALEGLSGEQPSQSDTVGVMVPCLQRGAGGFKFEPSKGFLRPRAPRLADRRSLQTMAPGLSRSPPHPGFFIIWFFGSSPGSLGPHSQTQEAPPLQKSRVAASAVPTPGVCSQQT